MTAVPDLVGADEDREESEKSDCVAEKKWWNVLPVGERRNRDADCGDRAGQRVGHVLKVCDDCPEADVEKGDPVGARLQSVGTAPQDRASAGRSPSKEAAVFSACWTRRVANFATNASSAC